MCIRDRALIELKQQGAKSIVLDLRGNGGGLLGEAVNVVNFFVPKGKEIVVTTVSYTHLHMPALLVPGMTVTNEPGIYKTGRHGVRTENTMLIVPSQETEFGTYYKFEPLTLCPIDKEAILTDCLLYTSRCV